MYRIIQLLWVFLLCIGTWMVGCCLGAAIKLIDSEPSGDSYCKMVYIDGRPISICIQTSAPNKLCKKIYMKGQPFTICPHAATQQARKR